MRLDAQGGPVTFLEVAHEETDEVGAFSAAGGADHQTLVSPRLHDSRMRNKAG